MIYIKQNQVYYLIAQPVGELYYDLYNFSTMIRVDNAYKDAIISTFSSLGLLKASPEIDDKYCLVFDFLANSKTDYLSSIVDQVANYLNSMNFNFEISDDPLLIKIDNLKIGDLIKIVQDDKFQTINTIVAVKNSSVWKLYKK